MPEQSDWTRVKDPVTGHERSTLVVLEGEEPIDKPAADVYGQPYAPKHNRPLRDLEGANGKSVAKMTLPELVSYANAEGVVLAGEKPTKDDVLNAIAQHEGDDQTSTATGGEDPQA